jgi:hypothetical protein
MKPFNLGDAARQDVRGQHANDECKSTWSCTGLLYLQWVSMFSGKADNGNLHCLHRKQCRTYITPVAGFKVVELS